MPFVLCLEIQMVNDKRDTCVQFSVGGTKMKRIGYKHTVAASFTAFVVQAVVNNFAPLLFLTFQAQYGIRALENNRFNHRELLYSDICRFDGGAVR